MSRSPLDLIDRYIGHAPDGDTPPSREHPKRFVRGREAAEPAVEATEEIEDAQDAAPTERTPLADDPFTPLLQGAIRRVATEVGSMKIDLGASDADGGRNKVRSLAIKALAAEDVPLSRSDRERLVEQLTDEMLGYGPLQPLFSDDTVSEVMVNGFEEVWVERAGRIELTDVRFHDEDHLLRIIDRIVTQVGRRIDESSPMVDARLPDGSRVNAVIPPLAMRGAYLTIRRFRDMPLSVETLIDYGTLSRSAALFLELAVKGGANVLISGGTGTGKTTTLNVLSSAIPEDQRIVTIEDAAELQLNQRHVLPMESRPANIEGKGIIGIRDLLRNSLRMRPDRIIVGECRGGEAVDMLQAMNTGHDGCMTTIHANSPRDAVSRLETLVLTAGVDLPSRAIREQIGSAFDLIVQLERLVDGSRKVTAITEVAGMEGGVVTLQDLFLAKSGEATGKDLLGPLNPTGVVPRFLEKLKQHNVEIPMHVFTKR